MTAAVEVRDVFRIHQATEGGVAALQGLTMDVAAGEVCVVLGPSGSGKTTLLRLLAGLDPPSAGTVSVLGRSLRALPSRKLAAYRSEVLGYVDQHYSRALARELPARELVGVQLGLQGAGRAARLAVADGLLERVGLGARGGSRPGQLSGGEQQRVAVCAALAHRPRLLLADEPTGELDAASSAEVFCLVAELVRETGATAIIVSHDPASVSIADRVVRIRDGRLSEETAVRDGGPESIVVGRGGWLRLPEELLRLAGVGGRATARLAGGGIELRTITPPIAVPAGGGDPAAATNGAPAAPADAQDGSVVAEVRGATRTFASNGSQTVALHALSASFSAGRLVALTGPSGSGKTTLLHLLAGLDLPSTGEVVVLGTSLAGLDRAGRAALRRDAIGVVSQEILLVPYLTCAENVELGLALRRIDAAQSRTAALEALAAVGLAELADRRVGELSSGQRGRVALARAVAPRPRLLLVDEPTSRLDQANALAVGDLLRRLARESGTAVVCATHDPLLVDQADEELVLGRQR